MSVDHFLSLMIIPSLLFAQWRSHVNDRQNQLLANEGYKSGNSEAYRLFGDVEEQLSELEESTIEHFKKSDDEIERLKTYINAGLASFSAQVSAIQKKDEDYKKKVDTLIARAGFGL